MENVLQTNVGYQALLKLLFYLLPNINEDDRDKKEVYLDYLNKIEGLDFIDSGEEKRYPFTSASVNILYKDMVDCLETD